MKTIWSWYLRPGKRNNKFSERLFLQFHTFLSYNFVLTETICFYSPEFHKHINVNKIHNTFCSKETSCYISQSLLGYNWYMSLNPSSANPTKWSSTLKQFVGYFRFLWPWYHGYCSSPRYNGGGGGGGGGEGGIIWKFAKILWGQKIFLTFVGG